MSCRRQSSIAKAMALSFASLLLAAAITVVGADPSLAATPTFLKRLAGPSSAAIYPGGLDYDAANKRLVVADTGRDKVDFYTIGGTKLGEFGGTGSGPGKFVSPRDVAIDPASNIYVADAGNDRVQAFDANGNLRWTWSGAKTPLGITWDTANHVVLVTSPNIGVIYALDASGHLVWSSPTGAKTGLSDPRDAARGPDGRIWVVDYGHNKVKAFDVTSGGVWTTTPSVVLGDGKVGGHGVGEVIQPYNLAFSPDGTVVYVADTGNGRIARWSIGGSSPVWLEPYGSRCANPCPLPPNSLGRFQYLRRVAVTPGGDVIGADLWGNALQVFASDGTPTREIEGFPAPVPGFFQSFGVAVGTGGATYVVDRLNQRLERFDSAGTFLNVAGRRGAKPGQFSWPEGIAAAPDGSVWVADTRNGRLQHWPANLSTSSAIPTVGSRGSALGQFSRPANLAVDGSGNVWVADTWNNRIQEYLPGSNSFHVIGSFGSGAGRFNHPQGIAITPSAMFVADTGNNRVEKLGRDGTFIGSCSTGLAAPEGATLAPDGSIWVADTGNSRIVHLSSTLAPLAGSFGSSGTGTLNFDRPHSLAISGHVLFVADTYNSRVQEFDISGFSSRPDGVAETTEVAGWTYSGRLFDPAGVAPLYPAGGALAADGYRYVVDSGGNRIVRLSATGTQTTVSAQGWNHPRDIVADRPADTNLWVLNTLDNEVVKISPTGAVLGTLGSGVLREPYGLANDASTVYVADTYGFRVVALPKTGGAPRWIQTSCGGIALKRPRDVAVGDDGDLYVADADNHRVVVLAATTGACLRSFAVNGPPWTLIADGKGGLWMGAGARLFHVSSAGLVLGVTGSFGEGPGQFRSPRCIFADGSLIDVCDTYNFRIQRFSVGGNGNPVFDSQIGGTRPAVDGFNLPFATAYAPDGDLAVVDFFNQRVLEFSSGGSPLRHWGGFGSPPGSFTFPRGIAVSGDGATVVVCDSENLRLDLFTATGSFIRSVRPTSGPSFKKPRQVAIADDGSFWVADTGNGRVLHLSSTGAVLLSTPTSRPQGVALDSAGRVYVATAGGTLTKYSASGAKLTILATKGSAAGSLNDANELAIVSTSTGERILVADTANNRISEFTTDGAFLTSFGSFGSGDGRFDHPMGVAVTPDGGTVAVADYGNDRVSLWSS